MKDFYSGLRWRSYLDFSAIMSKKDRLHLDMETIGEVLGKHLKQSELNTLINLLEEIRIKKYGGNS